MNTKYRRFIDSLHIATKSKEISWNYLDEDKRAIKILDGRKSQLAELAAYFNDDINFDNRTFSKSKSFTTWLNDSDLLLFLIGNNSEMLLIVAAGGSFRTAVYLSDNEYGKDLIILLSAIRKQFPDPEDVINKAISQFLKSGN